MMDRFTAGLKGLAYSFTFAALLPASAAVAQPPTVASVHANDLAGIARSLGRGASLRIEGGSLDEHAGTTGLDLVRFEPAAPDAKFIAQTAGGTREFHPDVPVYFRGSVDGLTGSVAVVSFRSNGEMRGVVSAGEGTWVIGRPAGRASEFRSKKVKKQPGDPEAAFACAEIDQSGARRSHSSPPSALSGDAATDAAATASDPAIAGLPLAYTAQIAVELDFDFYQLFSNASDAAVYALDLLAFTGALGESELGMNVQVPYLQVWTTESDPYSGGEINRLTQVKDRWNAAGQTYCGGTDCQTIPRSTVLILSAAGAGGAAYVPALCDWYHSVGNGFSYASAGSMDANFDIESPSIVWDILVVTHELGHNFGSPHTHCYSPPVDECYSGEMGCYSGVTSLPSGCPGNGQGCGTIMGYCHRLNGGLQNVALTFGAGHPYGDTPQRVPDTMIDQLELEATFAPACLGVTNGMVELDVTVSGNGNGTVTSSPSGIECTSGTCRYYFDADEPVTLTPVASGFSEFAGWSGDADCMDGVVSMANATSCTATFQGSCGVLNEDCEDHNPCTTDSCPGDLLCVNSAEPRDASTCFASGGARIKITNDADPNRDKLQWQWLKGEEIVQGDLGDPSSTTDYALCIYDMSASTPSLAGSLALPGGSPGWKDRSPSGWSYSDGDAGFDGIRKLDLRAAIAGKSKVKLKAAGAALSLPAPTSGSEYFDEDPSIVVQLLSSEGSCWTSEFLPADTSRNTPSSFSASGN